MTIENIIIVGGGYAGVKTAQTLEKKLADNNNYRIILIDKVNYYECRSTKIIIISY